MQELSPPEQRLYIISVNHQPRERRWASRPRSEAPDRTADKRGHYRNQHQSEESDPNVMMEDEPSNSTQIVVRLFCCKDIQYYCTTDLVFKKGTCKDVIRTYNNIYNNICCCRIWIMSTTHLKSMLLEMQLVKSCGSTSVKWRRISKRSVASCPALTDKLR